MSYQCYTLNLSPAIFKHCLLPIPLCAVSISMFLVVSILVHLTSSSIAFVNTLQMPPHSPRSDFAHLHLTTSLFGSATLH